MTHTRRWRWLAAVMVVGATVGLSLTTSQGPAAQASDAVHRRQAEDTATRAGIEKLDRYTSRFYTIYTDLEREEAAEYAKHMDLVFAEYSRRFQSFRSRHRGSMPLYLFSSREEYVKFLQAAGINGSNSGGMFAVTQNISGLFVWVGGRSRSSALSTLQHEGFHQFAFNYIGSSLPVWVNEGMAQYFEDGIIVKGRMIVGIPNEARLQSVKLAIKEKKEIAFNDLLKISGQEWSQTLQTNPDKARLLYAQSWSLVYFLVHANRGKYRTHFEKFLQYLAKGHDVEWSFAKSFGSNDTAPFRQRWVEFIGKVQPDPVSTATDRMEFLGQALLFLQKQRQRMPTTIEQLEAALKKYRYRSWRTYHGIRIQYDSTDRKLYSYPLPGGGTKSFQLLEPARDGEPPRIAAPGLRPEPTLVWITDEKTGMSSDIVYR